MDATLTAILRPYNQTRIAEHLGVTRSTVHSWVHGMTGPSSDKLPKLAAFLRMDLGVLAEVVADDAQRRSDSVTSVADAS